jgi:hypothetical protein
MSNEREPADLRELESALGALAPRPPRLNRDDVLFRAGQAGVRRWRRSAVGASIVAVALAVVLVVRQPAERIVYVPVAAPADLQPTPPVEQATQPQPSSAGSGLAAYYRLQERVMNEGLDALPLMTREPLRVTNDDLYRGL